MLLESTSASISVQFQSWKTVCLGWREKAAVDGAKRSTDDRSSRSAQDGVSVFVLILKYCPPPTDSLPSLSFQIAICLSDFINFLHPSVSRPLFSSLFSQLATSPALKILLVLLYTFICVLCSFWQWLSAVWPRPPTNGRTHTHAHTKMGLCNCRVSTPVLQSSADIPLCRFTLKTLLWPRSQHSHPHLAAPTHWTIIYTESALVYAEPALL